MIKVGDKVRVKDNSYSLGFKQGSTELNHMSASFCKDGLRVLALGYVLPGGRCCVDKVEQKNDCILVHESSKDIVFSREMWLEKIEEPKQDTVVKLEDALRILAKEYNVPVAQLKIQL
jgi:LysM repeat protein